MDIPDNDRYLMSIKRRRSSFKESSACGKVQLHGAARNGIPGVKAVLKNNNTSF